MHHFPLVLLPKYHQCVDNTGQHNARYTHTHTHTVFQNQLLCMCFEAANQGCFSVSRHTHTLLPAGHPGMCRTAPSVTMWLWMTQPLLLVFELLVLVWVKAELPAAQSLAMYRL